MKLAKTSNTAREDFLAANPEQRKVQEAFIKEITERIGNYRIRMMKMAADWVDAGNEAREIGLIIINFMETLPGRQLTIDFWLQLEGHFIDQYGNPITQEMLKWFVKVATVRTVPFTNILEVLVWKQPLLLATGEEEFKLEAERKEQHRIPPPDEWNQLKSWITEFDIVGKLQALKSNPNYFQNGKLRPEVRTMVSQQWEPKFRALDELRRELGI